jgi:arsenate reductase-like glutaredoxin family protein
VNEQNLVENMLSANEIVDLAESLGIRVHDLLRPNSPVYKENKDKLLVMGEAEVASVIAEEPTLIKRPIIHTGKGYVIGLDEQKIRDIL